MLLTAHRPGTSLVHRLPAGAKLSLLAAAPSFSMMLAVLLWLSFIYGLYNGAMIPDLTEIMPTEVRVAGFSKWNGTAGAPAASRSTGPPSARNGPSKPSVSSVLWAR